MDATRDSNRMAGLQSQRAQCGVEILAAFPTDWSSFQGINPVRVLTKGDLVLGEISPGVDV